jgi:nitrogen fixation NifU-like protein
VSALDALYQEMILDHYRSPRGEGELAPPRVRVDRNNPLCGDEVHLEIRVEDGRIVELAHSGQGCSISRASTSMLAEVAPGLTTAEALELVEHFGQMLKGEAEPDEERLGDAVALEGVSRFPARIRCAMLGWSALQEAVGVSETGSGEA